jgi:hypothetical protein
VRARLQERVSTCIRDNEVAAVGEHVDRVAVYLPPVRVLVALEVPDGTRPNRWATGFWAARVSRFRLLDPPLVMSTRCFPLKCLAST